MTKMAMIRDINGYVTYLNQFPDLKRSATLAQNTEATVTVPGGETSTRFIAVFRYEPGTKVYFSLNGTAAVPAGATFASTTSCLNYPGTEVRSGDILSFITADTSADVQVEFYGI